MDEDGPAVAGDRGEGKGPVSYPHLDVYKRQADDYTDPAPATTFAHLDATTELSREIASLGIYPAVDPLTSTSRIHDRRYITEEHYSRLLYTSR